MTERMSPHQSPFSRAKEESREERNRLQRIYASYSTDPYYQRIWSNDEARFMLERKWEEIARLVKDEGVDVGSARVLDLGAGNGSDCERLRGLGFRPDHIVAIDLLHEYARSAKTGHGWLTVLQADGAHLPFRAGAFDLVYQSTVLSSVLDKDRRKDICAEVLRVLAHNGLFVSYDTRYPNPWNRNTHPLRAREMRAAFSGCQVKARSVTPVPQLMRLVGSLSRAIVRVIDTVPLLRSHLLAVVRKP